MKTKATGHNTTKPTPPDGSCPCRGFCTQYCCRDMQCTCYRGQMNEPVQYAKVLALRVKAGIP
jgi:hypothetical protein